MTGGRIVRPALALGVGALLALLVLVGAPQQRPAAATSPHRAAVVVDLGDGTVKVGCVSFAEDHISGLEALDRAAMSPVAQTYGGQGGAVCALCGKGCAAGSSCLTCKAPNYWAYYRDGVYSSVGASRTQVRDGDVEGWKWGKGERPANVSFSDVCLASVGPKPTASPPTSPPTTQSPPPRSIPPTTPTTAGGSATVPGVDGGNGPATPTTGSNQAPGGGGSTSTSTSVPPPTTSPSGSTPGASTTITTTSRPAATGPPSSGAGRVPATGERASGPNRPVTVERADASRRSSTTRPGASGSGNQWWVSVVGFTAAIGVVGALIMLFHRRRATAG